MQAPRLRATPLARAIAAAHALDLAQVAATAGERVRKADVLRMLESLTTPALAPESVAITEVTVAPLQFLDPSRVPVGMAAIDVDMGAVLVYCDAQQPAFARRRLQVTPGICAAQALILHLPYVPWLNSAWHSLDSIVLRHRIHLALARPDADGWCWQYVPDAGDLTLRGLVRALSSAGPDAIDVTCGVIDLSAGGTWPLAQAPLVGTGILLTIGAATMQPVVADDRIQIRPIARLSLAYDARYIDQAMAVGFLESVAQRLRTWVG